MQPQQDPVSIPQYSLRKILLVWAAAAARMGLLGWIIGPALTRALLLRPALLGYIS